MRTEVQRSLSGFKVIKLIVSVCVCVCVCVYECAGDLELEPRSSCQANLHISLVHCHHYSR